MGVTWDQAKAVRAPERNKSFCPLVFLRTTDLGDSSGETIPGIPYNTWLRFIHLATLLFWSGGSNQTRRVNKKVQNNEPSVSGDTKSDTAMLCELIEGHLSSHPYTNQYLYSAGLKPLDERDILPIDVDQPTYCYQHNEFMIRTLLHHGWKEDQVTRRGTIVVNRFSQDLVEDVESMLSQIPMTHSIIVIDGRYIVDVGFADNSLRDALEFKGVEEEVPLKGEIYKFERHSKFSNVHLPGAEWWSVSIKVDEHWLQLWRFPQNRDMSHEAMVELNHLLWTSTESLNIRDRYFVTGLVTPDKRIRFFAPKTNSGESGVVTLKIHSLDGKEKVQETITTEQDFVRVMEEVLTVSPLPDIIAHFNFPK
jgi:arylamine N-acetyltransferase